MFFYIRQSDKQKQIQVKKQVISLHLLNSKLGLLVIIWVLTLFLQCYV